IEVLHHEIERTVLELAEVEDADDVVVADAGRGLRLASEALDDARVVGVMRVQDLDRDLVADEEVARRVDRAHPALADLVEDFVAVLEHSTDEWIRCWDARHIEL